MTTRRALLFFVLAAAVLAAPSRLTAQRPPTAADFLSPAYPFSLVSARKADRIAWLAYEEGKRNAYTAAGPSFVPVRLTSFLEDDGTDISDLSISDDGSIAVFVRGTAPNRDGWVANPTSNPGGAERTIWAVRTATTAGSANGRAGGTTSPAARPTTAAARVGAAWRVAVGGAPELAPDGSSVLFVRDGQIFCAKLTSVSQVSAIYRGEEPFIKAWGTNNAPRWSPDGTKIAFVSNRVDHTFIGVYDVASRTVKFLSPSVDRDTSPAWSPDSRRIAFVRRPGLPFGQQAQQGGGGIGVPNGPAFNPNAATGRGGRGGPGRGGDQPPIAAPNAPGRAGQPVTPPANPPAKTGREAPPPAQNPPVNQRGGQQAQQGRGTQGRGTPPQGRGAQPAPTPPTPTLEAAPAPAPPPPPQPGLMRATLRGGYTLALMTADVAGTAEAREIWHNAVDERVFTNINNIQWAGAHIIFPATVPDDEWDRYFSVAVDGSTKAPLLLTTTDGLIEDATSVTLSPDGRTLYYSTNARDIDRRHIWAVPTSGGTPRQVTTGLGIETSPVVLSTNLRIAALTAEAKRPQSVGLFAAKGGPQELVFPTLPRAFPTFQQVTPENVTLRAPDGLEIHNQVFTPAYLRDGERRPAIVFVHGGPVRQMLLGYHYMHFYHMAYAANQWLASQGYVVMSVNFRSGIGYGRSFRQAPNTGGRGNAEYQDVLIAGKYLQAHPNVDPKRIGIWGLSYGGVLTAQALARNSDVFAAGVDLAGVHLWGSSLNPDDVSYQSSAIAAMATWKSPVLLVHGDDDRNVAFQQTTGLVQLLRARNIEHELIVFPDDTHESLLHSRWIYTFERMDKFLKKHLGEKK